jgi:hypothetical protein
MIKPRKNNLDAPVISAELIRELTADELDSASGGALEAYISVRGQKQGQFKGEDHTVKKAQ